MPVFVAGATEEKPTTIRMDNMSLSQQAQHPQHSAEEQ
jgi:hypothetical protein